MSIVRVGLAETDRFAEGYDLIFGKKEPKTDSQEPPPPPPPPEQQQDTGH